MFQFARDESGQRPKIELSNFRIESWKHNPYVGFFHNINYQPSVSSDGIMHESKTNPLVGFVRHSPSAVSKSLGLKRIICEDQNIKPPILTQMQIKRNEASPTPLSEQNFVRSLKQIPCSVYSISDTQSPTRRRSRKLDENSEDQCLCAICMEPYADGDEILTLACEHCYHSECASKWFYQDCLNSIYMESNFSCPKCRQNHVALSEVCSHSSFLTSEDALGISTTLLQIGQSLMNEVGYDFLSDMGSESPFEHQQQHQQQQQVYRHHLARSPFRLTPTRKLTRQTSSSTVGSSTTTNINANTNMHVNVHSVEVHPLTIETSAESAGPVAATPSVSVVHPVAGRTVTILEPLVPPHSNTEKSSHPASASTSASLSRRTYRTNHSPAGSVVSLSNWSDCGVPL